MKLFVQAVAAALLLAWQVAAAEKPAIEIDLGGAATEAGVVSPMLFGGNLSYFNDTDDVWADGTHAAKLREAGVGSLRYPGGEETSRFHWEHPGVTGYIDLWNEAMHGQNWQSNIIPPEQWETNTSHMDPDEFARHARAVGAEPLAGINMTSGVVMNRMDDSLAEAVRWAEHAKANGHGIRWWFLDNEPWHRHPSNYQAIPLDEYARLCVRFARAIREVDPEAKFIANPTSGDDATSAGKLRRFLDIAGADIDALDFHFYWELGSATWVKWLDARPLRHSSNWRAYAAAPAYADAVRRAREVVAGAGHPHVKVVTLEWNVGQAEPGHDWTPAQVGLVQAEMLMHFAESGVEIGCVWPMFWQRFADDGTGQWRSWFDAELPNAPRASFDALRLMADSGGGRTLTGGGLSVLNDAPSLAVRLGDRTLVYLLNKDDASRQATIRLAGPAAVAVEHFTAADGLGEPATSWSGNDEATLTLPPTALTRVTVYHAKEER